MKARVLTLVAVLLLLGPAGAWAKGVKLPKPASAAVDPLGYRPAAHNEAGRYGSPEWGRAKQHVKPLGYRAAPHNDAGRYGSPDWGRDARHVKPLGFRTTGR